MQKFLTATAIALCTFATAAGATNFGASFLTNAPIRYFNDTDMKLFTTTATKALDTGKDGATISWRNPQTTAHGYFIPSRTTDKNGTRCRNLEIFNAVIQGQEKSAYKFCKIDGDWKIVS